MYNKDGNLDYDGDWDNGKMTKPEKSVSYKALLLEHSQDKFRYVTFKGWQNVKLDDGREFSIELTDEYHLNSDYTIYGTNEYTIKYNGANYRTKQRILGTFDPVTSKIHIRPVEILYQDDVDGLKWIRGSADGTVYVSETHPFHYIIKGADENGNEFEEADY